MKLYLLTVISVLALSSCSKEENGTLEIESLSKRVFESLRANDPDKFGEVLPDDKDFKRYFELRNLSGENSDDTLQLLKKNSEQDFKTVRSQFQDWDDAIYANTADQTIKADNVTESLITTKFKSGNETKKLSFTAVKINGRWYYSRGLSWVMHDNDDIIQTPI